MLINMMITLDCFYEMGRNLKLGEDTWLSESPQPGSGGALIQGHVAPATATLLSVTVRD